MNKFKIIFCLFLFIMSFSYMAGLFNNMNLFELLLSDNKKNVFFNNIVTSELNKLTSNNVLNLETKNASNQEEDLFSTDPVIYFYNTHQTEEYQNDTYSINPTVVTVSEMLKDELKEYGLYSIVEDGSIKEGLNKYGYDYSYSYRISLEYLKQKQEKFPSLEYFFDIHRDSVQGENSRCEINGKKYAKIMFLIGKKNENYKENEAKIKIMQEYLNTHYEGILRPIYYQGLYSYNQEYNDSMFLVEFGGVDNTLEELYNSSIALAGAIKYLIGGEYEE